MSWSEGGGGVRTHLNKLRSRCHWRIDSNMASSAVAHSSRWPRQWAPSNQFQSAPPCGLPPDTWLIDTHGVNNNIQSITCSAELKTAIVSPMDWVDSPPRAEKRNKLHLTASRPLGGRGGFSLYLVHSWIPCGPCCTHSCPPRTGRTPHTAGRCTGRRGRHTRCPSSRCSTGSAPWCTGRSRCTGWDRRLRGELNESSQWIGVSLCFS